MIYKTIRLPFKPDSMNEVQNNFSKTFSEKVVFFEITSIKANDVFLCIHIIK